MVARSFHRLIELISLPRPQLFVIPAAAGVCGLMISSLSRDFFGIIFAALIPVLIWSGGQVLNDLFDSEFDSIHHPEWPIPSGIIPKKLALTYGVLFYIMGLSLAFYVNIYCFGATMLATFFATIYNNLKRKGIYGNICFGLAVASCVLIGATINKNISNLVLSVVGISILIHTSDNIIGTFADTEADKKMGFKTVTTQIGPKYSAFISFLLISIASIVVLLLWKLGLGILYLPLAIIAIISLLWTSFLVLRNPNKFCNLGGFWVVYSFFMGEILLYMSLIIK
ncbi:UbiA family prenyltransferase [Methanobacterium ferruginis]|uniref:UbiA family prenyltransferase n=1 Tax=Methanobacterium ferruginis TaxID=710191 RepID=UPI00257395FA|nr:UbiA family prenyltransferase [Methanobacterium ferruginis]